MVRCDEGEVVGFGVVKVDRRVFGRWFGGYIQVAWVAFSLRSGAGERTLVGFGRVGRRINTLEPHITLIA